MSKAVEGRFELGDFELQSGTILPDVFLGYATHGTQLLKDHVGETHA